MSNAPRMGRPRSLSLEDEAMIYGLLSMHQRKTPEWRLVRIQLAARFGLTPATIENIHRRHYDRLVTNEKARAPSNGDTGRNRGGIASGCRCSPYDTTAPDAEGNGKPSKGGCN